MYWKVASPLYLGAACLFLYLISHAIKGCLRRQELGLDPNRMLNIFFSLIYTFFNAIVGLSLLLVKCVKHPNGTWTLSSDYTVNCFESGTWQSMLALTILAIV